MVIVGIVLSRLVTVTAGYSSNIILRVIIRIVLSRLVTITAGYAE